MSDLMSRLSSLHGDSSPAVSDDTVAADLRRGHAALAHRRRRRTAFVGAATLAAVTVGSLSYATMSSGPSPNRREAALPRATNPASATPSPSGQRAGLSSAVRLVAYRGSQLPGYSIKTVPAGYVLQGISGSVLDISAAGDHSSLDSFVGKITVMLNDYLGPSTGTPVTVNGHPGRIGNQDGVQALTYRDGPHNVEVQAWSNIHITVNQMVAFADGITVLPGAQVSHG